MRGVAGRGSADPVTSISRRLVAFGLGLAVPSLCLAQAPNRGSGGWGIPWTKIPSITVLWTANDSRVQLVRAAAEFWNRVFTELGTPFRLGAVTYSAGALPVDQLKSLSEIAVNGSAGAGLAANVYQVPGDLIAALSDGNFISFALSLAEQPEGFGWHQGFRILSADAPQCTANRHRARVRPRDRIASQQRSDNVDVRPAIVLPSRRLRIVNRQILSTDRARENNTSIHLSSGLEAAVTNGHQELRGGSARLVPKISIKSPSARGGSPGSAARLPRRARIPAGARLRCRPRS